MSFPHICKNCKHRQSLRRKIQQYIVPPVCHLCNSRNWRLDHYRLLNPVRSHGGKTCGCDGYWFPHRSGSLNCRNYKHQDIPE
jgi:hypothetical protein